MLLDSVSVLQLTMCTTEFTAELHSSGVYEKPPWLSAGSLELLNAMLQVLHLHLHLHLHLPVSQTDPKRRITIRQLLAHPWLMDGYDTQVKWQSRYCTMY